MAIVDIVDAVANPSAVWRTLHGVEPVWHNNRPRYVTGNAAVTFTVRHEGRLKMLKCYTRSNRHLSAIYGATFHPRELCVISLSGQLSWVDCLLYDRIEGRTLDEVIGSATGCDDFQRLATEFDCAASRLLAGPMAHGDIKPENIVVGDDGVMHFIDFDAAFLPSMAGEAAPEIGTAAYQHPKRNTSFFDRHIDDYSIAMLSTTLHAASLNEEVAATLIKTHEPPFSPHDITNHRSALFDSVVELFARRGLAAQYRMAQMLYSASPRLFGLQRTLDLASPQTSDNNIDGASLEQKDGLWGCRNDKRWIIPPLFDSGFEPLGDYIILYIEDYAHLLSLRSGAVVGSFERGVKLRPHNRHAITIYKSGEQPEVVDIDVVLQNSAK